MKNVVGMSLFVVLMYSASCGTAIKEFSGFLGSCVIEVSAASLTVKSCLEQSFTVEAAEDPTAELTATLQSTCETQSGTYSTSACDTTGAQGLCEFSSTSDGSSISVKNYYYQNEFIEESTNQESCVDVSNGTYTSL